ncbi:MAG: hypothetical protein ACRCXA_10575 [Peptostreptococcaceae bacterium]
MLYKKLTRKKKLEIIKNPSVLLEELENKENYTIGETYNYVDNK